MTITSRRLALLTAALTLTLVGCRNQSSATATVGAASSPAPPAVTSAPPPAAGETFTGEVVETMNAGGYSYLKLQDGSKSVWAAALEFPIKTGERATVRLESPMTGFTSKTLNRTFPVIYFVSDVTRDGRSLLGAGAASASSAPALAASHGAPSSGAPAGQVEKVAPPAGGLAIADVWAKRKTLGGTRVTVSGKVVKVNNGILGRNWIHLQDGSGSESAHNNDLTVTTSTEVKMGDVVTATGTLGLDKDFGAGYVYDAIIEGATVTVAKSAY